MEKKQLTRSNNRMIAGVCSGIADYFGWDVTLFRLGCNAGAYPVCAGYFLYRFFRWYCLSDSVGNYAGTA